MTYDSWKLASPYEHDDAEEEESYTRDDYLADRADDMISDGWLPPHRRREDDE